jgi:hypothetical protein
LHRILDGLGYPVERFCEIGELLRDPQIVTQLR